MRGNPVRRLAIPLGLLGVALGAIVLWRVCAGHDAARRGGRPHLLIYLIDTLRADHLGAYGYPRETSPHLDAFAKDAVLYWKAYVPSSWTRPSVGSLFTGLHPSRHGAVGRMDALRADVPTLAELLTRAGYTAVAFLTNPNVLPAFGFGRGFGRVVDLEAAERTATARRVHEAVLAFLDTAPPGPLFLYVHTLDPHVPYAPPEPFERRFQPPPAGPGGGSSEMAAREARYDGEIAYADAEFGAFLDELARRGLYDDAIIVVLSDHGEEFGDHGGRGHGKTLFEEQLRVPLIVRLPGGAHAGAVVEQPVRVIDLFPTLLAALDVDAPPHIDARGFRDWLRPYARGDEPPIYAELDLGRSVLSSLTRGRFKLIRRRLPRKQTLLFDVDSDPAERHDIAAAQPAILRDLERRMLEIENATGGLYLDLVNGDGASNHVIAGSLRVVDARIADVATFHLEEGDEVELGPDRRTLAFRVTLENRPNPAGERPRTLVDLDRIRLALEPPQARLAFSATLDGAPLGAGQLWLGERSTGADASEPIRTDDLETSASLAMVRRAHPAAGRPHARLYQIPTATSAPAVIDPALRERLEALGYGEP